MDLMEFMKQTLKDLLNFQLLTTIGILIMTIPFSQQTLIIDKINSELGFAKIQTDEIEAVSKFDIVLHIINPKEILTLVEKIERTTNSIDIGLNKNIVTNQLESIKSQINTLIPHRRKRGLVNLGGTILKWIFGTMDDYDRQDIEDHLGTIDKNNHEVIQTVNQQIKSNDNYNKTFMLIKNAIEADRLKINSKLNGIEKRVYTEGIFLEQMVKIDFIRRQVENIQDNFASARLGILHPSILTDEEIRAYDIDSRKLTQIRLGVARYYNESIIFATKIPKEFQKFSKKLLIPIVNSSNKQIDQEIEFLIEINNKTYTYEKDKTLKELKRSKNCVFKNNCKFITNYEEEYIEIEDDIIVLNNMKNRKFNNSCDDRNLILNGNYFIHFQNCTVQIENKKYTNKVNKFISKFIVPIENIFDTNKTVLTFEDIVINQEKNIKEIKELKYQKHISFALGISSFSIILIVAFLILLISIWRRKSFKFTLENKIQENPKTSGGGVTYCNSNVLENKNVPCADNAQSNIDTFKKVRIQI